MTSRLNGTAMNLETTMASLDFEQEKSVFRKYYESNRKHFADAKNAYIRIINSLIKRSDVGAFLFVISSPFCFRSSPATSL
jgi:hypothetical protein